MTQIKRLTNLAVTGLLMALLLGACGDSTATVVPNPTATPVITTAAATTVLATTVSASTTVPPTVATTAVVPATTAAITTVAPGTNAASAAQVGAAPLTTAWVKDGVCYEVFVRSFFDSNGDGKGDLPGLISKLDYLNDGNPNSTKSLGINCIWLMPITASPSYHGYDTTDFYKINPDYGTNDDFKKLIQEAHKRGIYIVMDLVLNHTSNQHPWFKQAAADPKSPYRDWYIFSPTNPGYNGPFGDRAWFKNPAADEYYYGVFGSDLPDLNYRNPAVTKQMQDVTRFWLQDMGVDGFRLDAVKHLIEDGQKQENTDGTHAWLRDFRKIYTALKPEAYTIGEIFNASSELYPYYPDQLDAYFEFGIARSVLNSANRGQASFVALAQDTNNKLPFQRYGTFLTNHDQDRVMGVLGGSLDKMKVAAAAYLTLPGLPFIYYGEEVGMQGGKPDPQIRTPMQWTADLNNSGFSTAKPWEPPNADTAKVNVQAQEADPDALLNLYRKLIQTRRANPALSQGNLLRASNSESFSVATYLRYTDKQAVLVVLNMGDSPVKDLKISLEKSDLAAGQYSPTALLNVNAPAATFVPFTVGAGGALSEVTLLPNLPAHSGYVILLKK